MSTLLQITKVETKLFLREPLSVGFGILFPTAILLGLGAIPALRQPSPEFGGARFVELWAPTALVITVAMLGLQHIPGAVATYRENGILRRLSTTPVHPGTMLAAQLIVAFGAATISAVLLVLSAWLILDVPLPGHPLAFAATFVVGFGAILALGMVIAAVAPNARIASGASILVSMLVMFVGGVYLPRFLLPDALVRLGDFTPPGVQALLDAWSDNAAVAAAVNADSAAAPLLLQLGIMALIAVAAGALAAKLFRWEAR